MFEKKAYDFRLNHLRITRRLKTDSFIKSAIFDILLISGNQRADVFLNSSNRHLCLQRQ